MELKIFIVTTIAGGQRNVLVLLWKRAAGTSARGSSERECLNESRSKEPFSGRNYIPCASPNNTPRPQPDGCGDVFGVEVPRLWGWDLCSIPYQCFPPHQDESRSLLAHTEGLLGASNNDRVEDTTFLEEASEMGQGELDLWLWINQWTSLFFEFPIL